ncbi:transcription termination/antitermination protein NusG [Silvibacterium acidisoli]|uniref:transcription termination/antitermination protein NusG n=1 Tax=Acidobacteriaceae bacterium ZG23-2 TaxID=2883246 RepID=UPI00406D2D11
MTNHTRSARSLAGPSSAVLPKENGENFHWCAIYTYPRHEKAVADALERKDLEVFLPTFLSQSQWKDRRVKLMRPLFPSYVFTRLHAGDQIKVLTVSGVVRIVSFQGAPAAISDEEVDSVRRCMKGGAVLEPCPMPALGERVRVRSGVFSGVEGVVVSQKNRCKLVISISLVNQSVSFEIDGDQLERPSALRVSTGI